MMMRVDDDAALLEACRAGDAAGWEALIRRYQRLIYAIPRRAGLNDDLAAEVFQRVCVILFEHLDRIERPERLGAWLATTARRESWRLLRHERATTILVDNDDDDELAQLADPAPLPDEMLERQERQQAVRRAVTGLDRRSRTLMALLFYHSEPASYAEIAATLGIPEGSVGPTRARCLRKLQRALTPFEL
jgi:RNA polymerase sigma factor (sigma-70 family)